MQKVRTPLAPRQRPWWIGPRHTCSSILHQTQATDSFMPSSRRQANPAQARSHRWWSNAGMHSAVQKSALDLELLALPLYPNFCPVNTMRLMIPYEHQDLVTKTTVREWRRRARGWTRYNLRSLPTIKWCRVLTLVSSSINSRVFSLSSILCPRHFAHICTKPPKSKW